MLVFPQLSTGAGALYPVTKRRLRRTAVNMLADGRLDVSADPDAAIVGWELRTTGLTPTEWNAIENLFQQTSGMARSFTFLDPVGNLLLESEDFGGGAWTRGGLIQAAVGIADPLGTTRATTLVNGGQIPAGLTQTLGVPGNFQYCLSVWVRSTAAAAITLSIGSSNKSLGTTPQWTRVFLVANPGQGSATSVAFGVTIPAGGSVAIFGMQLEAQLGPSDYKMNGARGGVYAKARFGSDQITVTAQGSEVYDAVISIVNTEN